MKINEFVEKVNQNKGKLLKPEQVQAFVKKELEVKEYISIKEKKQVVDDIINECILYEDGVFKFDEIDKYICFTMKTIAAYTNIELSDDVESDYDILCESKLLNTIIESFNGEYENVKILLQMKCDYILSGNNIEAQIGKFFSEVLDKLGILTNTFSEKISDFNFDNLPIDKENLDKIIKLANLQN